jgi:hypothetical protein
MTRITVGPATAPAGFCLRRNDTLLERPFYEIVYV